jgi:hypothetical protein
MAIKKKRSVDNLKRQDKELAKLPVLEKEEKVFRKKESLLSRLLVRKRVVVKKPKIPKELKLKRTKSTTKRKKR